MIDLQRSLRAGVALALMCVMTGAYAQTKPEATPATPAAADCRKDGEEKPSIFRSPDDCAFDMSAFIDQAYGFMPLAVPITEPAVGMGAVGAVAFIDKYDPEAGAGFGRPNITVLGALGTENGTRGKFAIDMRNWFNDRVQTLIGAMQSDVNLDYYGMGRAGYNGEPRAYTLEVSGALAQAKVRLGDSPNWMGLGYAAASTRATFDSPITLPDRDQDIDIGGVMLSISHDSRDNMFTPTEGYYAEATANVFNDDLGSDRDFKRYTLTAMQYFRLDPAWTLGLREGFTANSGDAPFYLQPYVYMRGVPAMRYQGEKVAQAEAEVRWQFMPRYSAVAFAGAGAAANDTHDLDRQSTVAAGGVGIRYEIARKYGMHMGMDVAWSRDGPAVYVQFGSAWMRP